MRINSKQKLIILLMVVAGFLFVQIDYAHAGILDWSIERLIAEFLDIVKDALIRFLAFLAQALQAAINLSRDQFHRIPAVEVGWRTMRDLVNMFLILILLVIAFGTIFDTSFGAKNTLARFILVALLVNFSLVFTFLIVDISNILASAFLSSIGNEASIGFRFGQMVQPQSFFPDERSLTAVLEAGINDVLLLRITTASLLLSIVFTGVALFAFILALAMVLVRVPVLWFLAIFSPLAFAAFVLPNTKKYFDKWLSAVMSWSFVLPLYIFFLFLGIHFFNNAAHKATTLAIMQQSFGARTGILNNIANYFGLLLNYLLAMFIIIYGAIAAKGMGNQMGSWAAKAQTLTGSAIKSRLAQYSGAGAAWQQFKETGRIGQTQTPYRGEQGRRLREARGAEWAMPGRYAKEQFAQAEKEAAAMRARRLTMKNEDEFEKYLSGMRGYDSQGLAAKMILAERGKIVTQNNEVRDARLEDVLQIYKQIGGDKLPAAQKITENLHRAGTFNKWDLEQRKAVAAGNVEAASDFILLRRILAESAIKEKPGSAVELMGPVLKIIPAPEDRDKFVENIKWDKAIGEIKAADKTAAVSRIRELGASGEISQAEKDKIIGELKKFNPALVAEATGKNVREVIAEKLKEDSNKPKELSQYMPNLIETYRHELSGLLNTELKSEINTLFKNANVATRSSLSQMGVELKRERRRT